MGSQVFASAVPLPTRTRVAADSRLILLRLVLCYSYQNRNENTDTHTLFLGFHPFSFPSFLAPARAQRISVPACVCVRASVCTRCACVRGTSSVSLSYH